jgi:hypothetical protein
MSRSLSRLSPADIGRVVLVQAKCTSPTTRAVVVEVSPRGAARVVPLRKDGTLSETSRWTGDYHTVQLEAIQAA